MNEVAFLLKLYLALNSPNTEIQEVRRQIEERLHDLGFFVVWDVRVKTWRLGLVALEDR